LGLAGHTRAEKRKQFACPSSAAFVQSRVSGQAAPRKGGKSFIGKRGGLCVAAIAMPNGISNMEYCGAQININREINANNEIYHGIADLLLALATARHNSKMTN
jgi:hypothetical protein